MFAKHEYVPIALDFIQRYHSDRIDPDKGGKVTLVTGMSDYPASFIPVQGVDKTYSVNSIAPQSSALPLGIADPWYPHGKFDALQKVAHEMLDGKIERDIEVLVCHCMSTAFVHRYAPTWSAMMWRGVKMATYKTPKDRMPYEDYLRLVARSRKVLCLCGNGFDTHRLWESLYLGAEPIVECLYPIYRLAEACGFPHRILTHNDTKTFGFGELEKYDPSLGGNRRVESPWSHTDYSFLTVDYWMERFRS